jgi:hypothetical protein
MKRTIAVLALILLVVSVGGAQWATIRSDQMLCASKHYLISTGDSLTGLPIAYQGSNSLFLYGQIPDSIRITNWASSDTLKVDMDIKFGEGGISGYKYAYTYVDSIVAGAWKSRVIARSLYNGADVMGLALLQRSTGASAVAANNYLWVRIERYFSVRR